MQLGKQSGRESISVAVEVATKLMSCKGITPIFSLNDFRDNIPTDCGVRSQSRVFTRLNQDNIPNGKISIKVPVVHSIVFPPKIFTRLAKSMYLLIIIIVILQICRY